MIADSWPFAALPPPPPPFTPNWPNYLLPSKTAGAGGKENTPFFKPYWYAAAPKAMFFVPFRFENGYRVCPFWSGIVYGFRGNCGIVWTYLSFQLQMNKKERVICKLQNHLKKSSCWRFNLSNDDIIFAYVNMYVAFFDLLQVWKRVWIFWGQLWKRVWKMTFFCCEIGSWFGELGGTPSPRILRSYPRVSTITHLKHTQIFHNNRWYLFPFGILEILDNSFLVMLHRKQAENLFAKRDIFYPL